MPTAFSFGLSLKIAVWRSRPKMDDNLLVLLFLAIAAFLAGMLNTVAGGGTFLTFPALVFTGIPVVAANATSAVAVFPGYLGGAIGFRKELAVLNRGKLIRITSATALGGPYGSLLLLVSSNQAFSAAVPFLLALATLAFAFGDRIQESMRNSGFGIKPEGSIGIALVLIYGGYFNGGLGIVLLNERCFLHETSGRVLTTRQEALLSRVSKKSYSASLGPVRRAVD